jgi:hypothetical protein
MKKNVSGLVMSVLVMGVILIAGCATPIAPTNPQDVSLLNQIQGEWTGQIIWRQGFSPITITLTFTGQEVNVYDSNSADRRARSNNPLSVKTYDGYVKSFQVENGKIIFYLGNGSKMTLHLEGRDVLIGVRSDFPDAPWRLTRLHKLSSL